MPAGLHIHFTISLILRLENVNGHFLSFRAQCHQGLSVKGRPGTVTTHAARRGARGEASCRCPNGTLIFARSLRPLD